MADVIHWILDSLTARGWTQAELARRSEISTAQIAQTEQAIAALLDLAETGTLALGEIRKRLVARESELAALRQQRATLPAQAVQPFDAAATRALLATLAAQVQAEDVPVARRALAQIIARVIYEPVTGIEIVYRERIGV